jgi:hypothetical protein
MHRTSAGDYQQPLTLLFIEVAFHNNVAAD